MFIQRKTHSSFFCLKIMMGKTKRKLIVPPFYSFTEGHFMHLLRYQYVQKYNLCKIQTCTCVYIQLPENLDWLEKAVYLVYTNRQMGFWCHVMYEKTCFLSRDNKQKLQPNRIILSSHGSLPCSWFSAYSLNWKCRKREKVGTLEKEECIIVPKYRCRYTAYACPKMDTASYLEKHGQVRGWHEMHF